MLIPVAAGHGTKLGNEAKVVQDYNVQLMEDALFCGPTRIMTVIIILHQ